MCIHEFRFCVRDEKKCSMSSYEIPSISVDSIVADFGISKIDWVKIDVDGAEYLVLKGAVELAKKGNAKFTVDVLSAKNLSIVDNTDKILSWCKDNDYKAYYLCEHRELIDSKYIEHRGRYHLLLIHKNEKYPNGLNNISQSEDIQNISIK